MQLLLLPHRVLLPGRAGQEGPQLCQIDLDHTCCSNASVLLSQPAWCPVT